MALLGAASLETTLPLTCGIRQIPRLWGEGGGYVRNCSARCEGLVGGSMRELLVRPPSAEAMCPTSLGLVQIRHQFFAFGALVLPDSC